MLGNRGIGEQGTGNVGEYWGIFKTGNIGESLKWRNREIFKTGGISFYRRNIMECYFDCGTCNEYQNFILLLSNTNYTRRFKLMYVLN